MPPLLTIWLGGVLAPLVAGLVASVLCANAVLRKQKPRRAYGLIAALAGILTSLWLIFRGDILWPPRWPDRIPERWGTFLMVLVPSICFTAVMAMATVVFFQDQYRQQLTVTERRALRRRRRENAWRRERWFRLAASCGLMALSTAVFVVGLSSRGVPEQGDVVDNYEAATVSGHGGPAVAPPRTHPSHTKPLLDVGPAAAVLWPLAGLGMLSSGLWLAHTIAYWTGSLRVRHRPRCELVRPYRAPTQTH